MNKDLYQIAESNDITIERMNGKIKALSVRMCNREFIGIRDGVTSATERTLLAHELGHCVTGAFYNIGASKIERGRAEHRATKWALLNCVPKLELIQLLKAGLNKWELADYFNVNEELINSAFTYYFEYGITGG